MTASVTFSLYNQVQHHECLWWGSTKGFLSLGAGTNTPAFGHTTYTDIQHFIGTSYKHTPAFQVNLAFWWFWLGLGWGDALCILTEVLARVEVQTCVYPLWWSQQKYTQTRRDAAIHGANKRWRRIFDLSITTCREARITSLCWNNPPSIHICWPY